MTGLEIAKRANVSIATVSRVINPVTWTRHSQGGCGELFEVGYYPNIHCAGTRFST